MKQFLLPFLLAGLIGSGCGPNLRLSQSWVAANATHPKFNKVIVLVLLYSVQSQTVNPGDTEALAKVFAKRVVADMKAKNVIS